MYFCCHYIPLNNGLKATTTVQQTKVATNTWIYRDRIKIIKVCNLTVYWLVLKNYTVVRVNWMS